MNYGASYRIPVPPSPGKTVYILGTSIIGPVNEPMKIVSVADAENTFGLKVHSPLSRAYAQFVESGGVEAYLVRIIGGTSSCDLYKLDHGVPIEIVTFEAVNAGEIGDKILIRITDFEAEISYPDNDSTTTRTYSFDEYDTVDYLCKAINNDLDRVMKADVLEPDYPTKDLYLTNTEYNQFGGGEDKVDAKKDELYEALLETLDLLEGRYMDLILLANMYVDDVKPDAYLDDATYGSLYYVDNRDYLDIIDENGHIVGFHKAIIDFCQRQLRLGILTHCIMGMNVLPNPVPEGYNSVIAIAKASPIGTGDGMQEYNYGNIYDNGFYISVCYGDYEYFPNTPESYIDNWYIKYAACWINSSFSQDTTGLSIIGGTNIQEFDDKTLTDLTALGVISYTYRPLRNWCVTAGVTQALSVNPLSRASNVKIVQRVLSKLNEDINVYLDSPSEPIITKSSLSSIVDKSLTARRDEDKIITKYDYTVTYNRDTELLTVDLDLYTIFSIEKIKAGTTVIMKSGW